MDQPDFGLGFGRPIPDSGLICPNPGIGPASAPWTSRSAPPDPESAGERPDTPRPSVISCPHLGDVSTVTGADASSGKTTRRTTRRDATEAHTE